MGCSIGNAFKRAAILHTRLFGISDRGRVLGVEEIPEALRERLRAANVSGGRATCASQLPSTEKA